MPDQIDRPGQPPPLPAPGPRGGPPPKPIYGPDGVLIDPTTGMPVNIDLSDPNKPNAPTQTTAGITSNVQPPAQAVGPTMGTSTPYAWDANSVFAPMQQRLGQAGANQMAASNQTAQSLFAQQGRPITAQSITGAGYSTAPGGAQMPTAAQANAARGGRPAGLASNPNASSMLDQLNAGVSVGNRPPAAGLQSLGGPPPQSLGLAGPPAFQTGAQNAITPSARPASINTAGLGAVNTNTAAQLGPQYQVQGVQNVAGRLGAAPQVGGVQNVAGRLGAAPQVGNVGNVSTGSAPGAVAGQLGTLGLNNANQGAFIDRTNQFLDRPDGPSVAEAQLQSAQADNMANLIGAARSGRGGAGDQAQALRDAMSAGSGIMSETAGQMATLRASEEDMRRNRELNAIGLGGQLSNEQRAGDLSFRGQDLSALQGDQSTALGARGQDLNASLANQSTQLGLEQLRGQLGISARGQDLGALQGDQSTALGLQDIGARTALGARGQDLGALQGDQSTALGLQDIGARTAVTQRGQNLSALQGDQSAQLGLRGQNLGASTANLEAALGARGQDVQQQLGLSGINAELRGQDLNAVTNDADRALAAQELGVRRDLGYGGLGLQAQQQGMGYDTAMQGLNLQANAMGQGAFQAELDRINQRYMADRGYAAQALAASNQPSFGEQLLMTALPVAANVGMRMATSGGDSGGGGGGVTGATAQQPTGYEYYDSEEYEGDDIG